MEMIRRLSSLFKAVVLISYLGLGFSLSAQEEGCIPEKPSASLGSVYDIADSFNVNQENRIREYLKDFSKQTSVEVLFITPRILCNLDVWNYAVRIENEWEVGGDDFNNGIVIVYIEKTIDKRGQIAIATGKNFETSIKVGSIKIIIDKEMIPLFKENQILPGLDKGIQAIRELLLSENGEETEKTSGC